MKNITRRQLLKGLAVGTAAATLPLKFGVRRAHAVVINSPNLAKWAQGLRGLGGSGIPVAVSDGPGSVAGSVHYSIGIEQFTDQLHPQLGGTTLWGYTVTGQPKHHLGGVIVAARGTPVEITFKNTLPAAHILPVDVTIPDADQAQNRTATHLHGGLVPWTSDGGPFAWFAPDGSHGPSFLNPGPSAGTAKYYYPNNQSARLVWYHDHAVGITRLNAYAGIASAYVITDDAEAGLTGRRGRSDVIPFRQLPVVIQDKVFIGASFNDPTWTGSVASPGSLWYPHTYDPKLYALRASRSTRSRSQKNQPLQDPSVVPEMFGDTMLANGTVYPTATVEPTRYRLRILNACNARFLNLQLYVKDSTVDGISTVAGVPTNAAGPSFLQIGSEGGFLPSPVTIPSNVPFNPVSLSGSLILGNAERADVIVDFSAFAGKRLILYNDAPAPFPFGDAANDYFFGNAATPSAVAGAGTDTRQILQFEVNSTINDRQGADPAPATIHLPSPPDVDAPLVNQATGQPLVAVTRMRSLTLNEQIDPYGRLIQMLGTAVPPFSLGQGFGREYTEPATEVANAGDVEVWEIYNLTGDTHPIHFHLVNVQVINRQAFRASSFNGLPTQLIGPARPPDQNEFGWKETVRMNPGEVTRVIMKLSLPSVPFAVPSSPRAGDLGVSGSSVVNEYVWHCHILEHEEHDMMRPLVVLS
jgi:spore coat protein A, manganese oxidase